MLKLWTGTLRSLKRDRNARYSSPDLSSSNPEKGGQFCLHVGRLDFMRMSRILRLNVDPITTSESASRKTKNKDSDSDRFIFQDTVLTYTRNGHLALLLSIQQSLITHALVFKISKVNHAQ